MKLPHPFIAALLIGLSTYAAVSSIRGSSPTFAHIVDPQQATVHHIILEPVRTDNTPIKLSDYAQVKAYRYDCITEKPYLNSLEAPDEIAMTIVLPTKELDKNWALTLAWVDSYPNSCFRMKVWDTDGRMSVLSDIFRVAAYGAPNTVAIETIKP